MNSIKFTSGLAHMWLQLGSQSESAERGTEKERRRHAPYPALFIWLVLLALGFGSLFQYEFAGAAPAGTPATLPAGFQVKSGSDRPILLFFVHPRCPCTAAAIAELDRVLSDYPVAFDTHVILPTPHGAAPDWLSGANQTAAKYLPGARLEIDEGGILSGAFQVNTSGTALVYDRNGRLVFQGGLTASRGHEGSNFGALALRALATGTPPARTHTPVFGCSLLGEQAVNSQESIS